MTTQKSEGLHTVMRWVRIPDGTGGRYCEDGREGIIDRLTELAVGPAAIRIAGRNIASTSEILTGI